MKRLISLLILLPSFLIGQDIIIKKNADEINAKVVEVGIDNIKYKKFDNLEGPTYVIPKYELFMIRYENGTKDVFKDKVREQLKEKLEKEKTKQEYNKFYVGLIYGANYSQLRYYMNTTYTDNNSVGHVGGLFGLDFEFYLNNSIALNSSLYYNRLNYDIANSLSYLSFPINFKYVFKGKGNSRFFLSSGFELGGLLKNSHVDLNPNYVWKKINLSYNIGLGVLAPINDRLKLNFELRECLGLLFIEAPPTIDPSIYTQSQINYYNDSDSKTQVISVLVGLSYVIK